MIVAIVILFVLAGVQIAFTALCVLTIGALARDHEAFKAGVRGMAGAADEAFVNDRTRIGRIEQFLVLLNDFFVAKSQQPDTDLRAQVSPKKDDFKN